MTVRRRVTALAGSAVVLFAGISLATGTAATAGQLECSSPPMSTSVQVHLEEPGLWSYTYQVFWCVDEGEVVRIVPDVAHKEEDGSKCTWAGQVNWSETPSPSKSGAWEVLDESKFSCETATGGTQSFNPWGIIVIRPDGTSDVVSKGIGDRVID
jgi:hypothetical protein